MSTLFGVTCPSDSGSCMMISCHKQGKVLICMQKTTSFAKSNQRNLIFSTKDTLESGHFMSVINILMQLRKVCNHPNLFEPRPIVSPFYSEQIVYHAPSLATKAMERDPFKASYFSVILVLGQLWTRSTGSAAVVRCLYQRRGLIPSLRSCNCKRQS